MTREVGHDLLTPALAARFAATFDRPVIDGVAPQGIHWCLCTPDTGTDRLSHDGHPVGGGGFLPASPLPRRMWAASSVDFFASLTIGTEIERRSTVTDMVEKAGGLGMLLFVTVEHETLAGGVLAIRETQTIVYREPASPGTSVRPPSIATPDDWPWRRTITPSTTLLFRYSAMTFNSHRIHYDLPYARDVEGYAGLVVHGPLMATLLLDLCASKMGPNRIARFAFRAQSPAFGGESLSLVGRPEGETIALAILGADGRTVMSANAARTIS